MTMDMIHESCDYGLVANQKMAILRRFDGSDIVIEEISIPTEKFKEIIKEFNDWIASND